MIVFNDNFYNPDPSRYFDCYLLQKFVLKINAVEKKKGKTIRRVVEGIGTSLGFKIRVDNNIGPTARVEIYFEKPYFWYLLQPWDVL